MEKDKRIGVEDLKNTTQHKNKKKINKRNNKRERIKVSIFEKFTTKENIIIFSFLLIFLIIGWNLIRNFNPFREMDYRKIDAEYFLSDAIQISNRETYWILNDILLYFLHSDQAISDKSSNNGEGLESNLYYNYSTEAYYDTLTPDYQTYLSKTEYMKLADHVISNYNENYEPLVSSASEVPIRKIYQYQNENSEYYLVQLNTSNLSYIGIELFRTSSQFNIFYLE